MNDSLLLAAALLPIYIFSCRLALRSLGGEARERALALLNLAGLYYFFFYRSEKPWHLFLSFCGYLVLVGFQYGMLRSFGGASGRRFWLAFFAPLAVLAAFRYMPGAFLDLAGRHTVGHPLPSMPHLIGLSYLAFRCSRLALEVRNGLVPAPGFWAYLNFAFFLPTLSVGPINTYANYRRGFAAIPWEVPLGRAGLRVCVGFVKYQFLSGLCNQLTYGPYLLNGHPHHWVDLPVAMIFYYLYLYCNFSGFCDMAIGAAALIGIPVLENFHNPFAARNIKDFWNRWHITLSQWMRDIVFAPLCKFFVRLVGPPNVNHAVAIAIFVVFLLIGIWHGVGWNYAIFGLFQALGVVANHYYTIGLKQWSGRDGFKAYMENRWIHAVAVGTTFCYYAASLMFFANSLPQIGEIFQVLR